jgi:cell division protein FtsB
MCKFFCTFAAIFEDNMTFSEFWTNIKIRKWGKYVVTLLVFLIIFLFVGDQSMLHFWHRYREIRHLEEQRDMYRAATKEAQQEIEMLQNADSLERYAREHYYMHAPDEDIYLIDETE